MPRVHSLPLGAKGFEVINKPYKWNLLLITQKKHFSVTSVASLGCSLTYIEIRMCIYMHHLVNVTIL